MKDFFLNNTFLKILLLFVLTIVITFITNTTLLTSEVIYRSVYHKLSANQIEKLFEFQEK